MNLISLLFHYFGVVVQSECIVVQRCKYQVYTKYIVCVTFEICVCNLYIKFPVCATFCKKLAYTLEEWMLGACVTLHLYSLALLFKHLFVHLFAFVFCWNVASSEFLEGQGRLLYQYCRASKCLA